MFNVYEKVITNRKGQRAGEINWGLQVALHHTPISTTSFQKICLGSSIPAPSTAGMQNSANKVSEKIEEENIKDLTKQRSLIKKNNTLREKDPHIVNVQADCIYNNSIYTDIGKTPFQPATQCVYSVVENDTTNTM